jgi:N-[(2S)-2-amino-2-carboxyethyl]-L-glutamate dehydrogenase
MLYLNADHIASVGLNWNRLVTEIEQAVLQIGQNQYAQPIKPYLRYGDPKNRIIAMPAYIGGENALAGIKWIASFPDNIHIGKLRANSVTILNRHDTGEPVCTINTTQVSAIRTAAVSGLLVRKYLDLHGSDTPMIVGMTGFGPIGRMHLHMVDALLGDALQKIRIYDLRGVDLEGVDERLMAKIKVVESWEACYDDADIFTTCTVSSKPYVDRKPKTGSLQLNVSLRDYTPPTRHYMHKIVVDSWEEICRENTDIENMHKLEGLQKEDTLSIIDVVCENAIAGSALTDVIMFNPMGMAVFDIAIGGYFYREALQKNIGMMMPD